VYLQVTFSLVFLSTIIFSHLSIQYFPSILDISGGQARADILQAGFEELFVILTNNTICYSPEPLTPTSVEWLTDLEIDLPITSGLEPLGSPTGSLSARLSKTETGFRLNVDSLKYSGIVRLKLQREKT